MLHINDSMIRQFLLRGSFGLEREGIRITSDGRPALTKHPFSGNVHITRDFSENQVEINTSAYEDLNLLFEELNDLDRIITETLRAQPEPEYLWRFSNPPYLKDDDDIPIAQFFGDEAEKTEYRNYLAQRYEKYMMTYSGIHVNYSFHPELIRRESELSDSNPDLQSFQNKLYLDLAQKAMMYAWVLVMLTAASPVADSSFVRNPAGSDYFCGLSSFRCSELGYWNYFVPVLLYEDIHKYAESIRFYVNEGLLKAPAELYYPIRLKPAGKNSLDKLEHFGINHIELRMLDLNPLHPLGIEKRDLEFIEMFLVWLASLPAISFDANKQIAAVENFKRAAHFDLEKERLVDGQSMVAEGIHILEEMERFYTGACDEKCAVLAFEKEKLLNPHKRYAWQVKELFSNNYAEKGIALAKEDAIHS